MTSKANQVWNWLQGKKTYIVAGITFILGGLTAIGVEIPSEVIWLLGAAGLGSVRDAIAKK